MFLAAILISISISTPRFRCGWLPFSAPFFTTKPTGQGNTGLGLSISRDLIVVGHNGDLEVQSEMGKFSEFTIRLPLNS